MGGEEGNAGMYGEGMLGKDREMKKETDKDRDNKAKQKTGKETECNAF